MDEPKEPKLDSFTSHSARWRQNQELWLLIQRPVTSRGLGIPMKTWRCGQKEFCRENKTEFLRENERRQD